MTHPQQVSTGVGTTASATVVPNPSDKGESKAAHPRCPRVPYEFDLLRTGSGRSDSDTRPLPIFVVGHPRSGTNWVANLLNLHPLVCIHGELHFHNLLNIMPELISEPHHAGFIEPVRSGIARGFQEFLRATIAAISELKPGGFVKWAGDHTPRLLRPMLPEASHIVIFRDGRDVAVSLTVHLLLWQSRRYSGNNKAITVLFDQALAKCTPDDTSINEAARWLLTHEAWVRQIAGNWSRHVLTDLAMIEKMHTAGKPANPNAIFPSRVLPIRYEDLHADTPGVLRRMFEFVGADPAQAAPVGADPRTAAGFTENAANSHYRRGKVGDWRTQLSPDAARWFSETAAEGLSALGYESTNRPAWLRP